MKKFLTVVLGSFVGAWIALMISSVLSIAMSFVMFGMMSGISSGSVSLSDDSILMIDLGVSISERSSDDDLMAKLMGNNSQQVGLTQMLDAIDEAKTNDKIKGIYIKCAGVSAGITTLYDLRAAIADFKESKKFVYAYGYEGISQSDYYVASVADSVFINPQASVDIHGLASQNLFFKKLLDKLGIEMQVLRVGTFKSAVEPYMLSEISEANRQQQQHYMNGIWKAMLADMAKSRKISEDTLNAYADSMLITRDAKYLVDNKLVDGICYVKEMEHKLKMKTCGEDEDLNLVLPTDMPISNKKNKGDKQIAVVYAEGEIDGGSDNCVDTRELSELIEDLADDDDVAAMVLRVNSPGGSAFGSEQLWKAIEDFKAKDKVVTVSMGDLAASGGYYISCGADRIFAQPTTLTGSIGIFGMIPCFETLASEKLGVTQNVVSTNRNGGFGSLLTHMTDEQRDAMQAMVNRGYELFTKRCADGRGVSQDSIKSIAEGRVWDGGSALRIGLVDEMGSLKDAISWTKQKLGLKECRLEYYPEVKTRWQRMLEQYATARFEARMRSDFGELYDCQKVAKQILNRDHVLCIMEPVEIR
ncbi:MAG: signal peptide peptidase SppA [Muribaculaceae bacterium]